MEPANLFSEEELQLAREMRRLGLPWKPQPGHFVLDQSGLVRRGSPFQDRVYFILNHEYFTKIAGGQQRFLDIMVWLPTWPQCRQVLRDFGMDDQSVLAHLTRQGSFGGGQERTELYRMIVTRLTQSGSQTSGSQTGVTTDSH